MLNVLPCCSENAIKVVAYAVDFREEIDDKLIHEAIAIHNDDSEFSQEFPHKNPQKSLKIEVRNGVQLHQEELSGIIFEKLGTSGEPLWSLILRKDALAVTCQDYSRWNQISTKAQEYMSKMINILQGVKVASVTLEYVDEFIITDPSLPWKEYLFNPNSKFFTQNVFAVQDFWHSHHGFFSECSCANVDKVLNTVNLDYVEEEMKNIKKNKVVIRTQHKARTDDVIIDEKFMDTIFKSSIEENHLTNKTIFRDILSEGMSKKIKLGDE